ncbi:histone-lysine N-methyltransferase SUV39H2 [Hetaerina americana]|uniref:histone-lysine N-methyltransferase SUV39H2 n=1 Tax=Hetaerina americana TaxID=62018 RepID=UPI003A7F445F
MKLFHIAGKRDSGRLSAEEEAERPVEGEVAMPFDGFPTAGARGNGESMVEVPKKSLRRLRNRRLKGADRGKNDSIPKDEYEVERIVDYDYDYGQHWYFIKWKGWKSKYNTWEPLRNLRNSQDLVEMFHEHADRQLASMKMKKEALYREAETIMALHAEINCTRLEMEKLLKKLGSYPQLPPQDDVVHCAKILKKKPLEKMKRMCPILIQWALAKAREKQLIELQLWEKEINEKCTDPAPIYVVNEFDLESAPKQFNYINSYVPSSAVQIPSEPILGCSCENECTPLKGCCADQAGADFAYNSDRKLRLSYGEPIYECNSCCPCPSTCTNRVVQSGRKYPLCIFRTSTGCGWGVRAVTHISKGSFICEYVGEVLTTDEAEKRGREYDMEGRTYLFDLDYHQNEETDDCLYTVDAAKYGNISHFINHSCHPNLQVFAVWIDCLDPNLPRLGLFSCRDINPGDEVTFDYCPHQGCGKANKLSRSFATKCKCGAKSCRKTFM